MPSVMALTRSLWRRELFKSKSEGGPIWMKSVKPCFKKKQIQRRPDGEALEDLVIVPAGEGTPEEDGEEGAEESTEESIEESTEESTEDSAEGKSGRSGGRGFGSPGGNNCRTGEGDNSRSAHTGGAETASPETAAPETAAPETVAPETAAPETKFRKRQLQKQRRRKQRRLRRRRQKQRLRQTRPEAAEPRDQGHGAQRDESMMVRPAKRRNRGSLWSRLVGEEHEGRKQELCFHTGGGRILDAGGV